MNEYNDIKFTKEEASTILELARVALSDAEIFDSCADKLDLADKELKELQEKIDKATKIDRQKIVIRQQKGLLELIECPKNIQIIINDYDIDGTEDNIKEDEYGQYREMEL